MTQTLCYNCACVHKKINTTSLDTLTSCYRQASHIRGRIKFSYKTGCRLRISILLNKINITTYFENLIVKLHIFYAFKFCVNRILFTI